MKEFLHCIFNEGPSIQGAQSSPKKKNYEIGRREYEGVQNLKSYHMKREVSKVTEWGTSKRKPSSRGREIELFLIRRRKIDSISKE